MRSDSPLVFCLLARLGHVGFACFTGLSFVIRESCVLWCVRNGQFPVVEIQVTGPGRSGGLLCVAVPWGVLACCAGLAFRMAFRDGD